MEPVGNQEVTGGLEAAGGSGGGMGGPVGECAGLIALASVVTPDSLHMRPCRRAQSLLTLLQLVTISRHQAVASSNDSGSDIILTLGQGNQTEWIHRNP